MRLTPLLSRPLLTCLLVLRVSAALPAPDADDGALRLPPGFRALVFADNLLAGRDKNDHVRFLTVSPAGDVYVKTSEGGIIALRDTTGSGRADQRAEFGRGGGTGIAWRDGWLYSSTDSAVYRYRIEPGQLAPAGEPECIVRDLPDNHQHSAKSFAFDGDGRLLVEVGSPSNSYGFPDRQLGAKGKDATEFLKTHGGFWRFDAAKPGQTQADGFHFSTGHRHSLAIAWNPVSHAFFMTMMGRDQLSTVAPQYYDDLDNAERVAEEFHELKEGANLGWPYSYYDPFKKARMVAPEFGGDNRLRDTSGKYDEPLLLFPAHWAPLQMTFYTGGQFPGHYRNGAFIAFHGSWNRAPLPQAGYKVVFVPFDAQGRPQGRYEVFADGFTGLDHDFTNTGDARYRPCGLAVGPDGSLYISDSERGRIWRILYTGEAAPVPASGGTGPRAYLAPEAAPQGRGAQIFMAVCAVCHMPDGGGVSGMQPPLRGSAVAAGDPALLINVLLRGPAAALPPGRPAYQNVMPAFSGYRDGDVAEVVNYVRRTFGNGAAPVSVADVAAQRLVLPSPSK